jgi:hypothetical protein
MMKPWIGGLVLSAASAFLIPSAGAEEGRAQPQFHIEDGYRAPVGPPTPRPRVRGDRAVTDDQRLGAVHLDQKRRKTGSVRVMEFKADTLGRRQFDNWDRMGRLPGFDHLDGARAADASRFEYGTGPYPRCERNSALERQRGICPPLEQQGDSRYLIVTPGDFAGQR